MLKHIYFLILIKVADRAILRNYLKGDLGWISENLHLAISAVTIFQILFSINKRYDHTINQKCRDNDTITV